jgi:hypothetical protein
LKKQQHKIYNVLPFRGEVNHCAPLPSLFKESKQDGEIVFNIQSNRHLTKKLKLASLLTKLNENK